MIEPNPDTVERTPLTVFLEPIWKVHIGYRDLLNHPPEGFRFVTRHGGVARAATAVSRRGYGNLLMRLAYTAAPMTILKSLYDWATVTPPPNTYLTYAVSHVVFRREPWVIELGAPWDPIGNLALHHRLFRSTVEDRLASEECWAVLSWSAYAANLIRQGLDCRSFERKITVVPRAVPAKTVATRAAEDGSLRLLFMGSANLEGEFGIRGGRDVVEAFRLASESRAHVRLTIRSRVPAEMRTQLRNMRGVRLMEERLSWDELEQLYCDNDVLVYGGDYEPWQVFLEAMSYGLPVLSTDVTSARERVWEGVTGWIVPRSARAPSYEGGFPSQWLRGGVRDNFDARVSNDLAERIVWLTEHPEAVRSAGQRARLEVETGAFSIAARNEILKAVFDRRLP